MISLNKISKIYISAILVFTLNATAISATKNEELPLNASSVKALYEVIQEIYVDDVDKQEVYENAIKGMINGLDPHSDFFKPKEQKKIMEASTGKFGGIGIVISKKDDFIEIVSPIDDTPGYYAGLKTGDTIIKIDDSLVRGMSLEDGVKLMRGKKGEEVVLTISRKSRAPFKVKIIRDIITIISAKGYLLSKDLAYIRVSSFQGPTIDLIKKSLKKIKKKNGRALKSIILDLRNNPGGLLTTAISVSNLFLDKDKLVVYTKGRAKGSSEKLFTKHQGELIKEKVVVLVNSGSASASEIVSGALQDHSRAIIIGEKTFGKGSVQQILPLPGGYGLKLTISRYYTPNGRSIQSKGIVPDIILKNLETKEKEEAAFNISEKDYKNKLSGGDDKPQELDKKQQLEEDATAIDEKTHKLSEKEKKELKAIENLNKDYYIIQATNILKVLNIVSPINKDE